MEENKKNEIELELTDIETRVYKTGKKIGQGGQGAVFHVKGDEDIAVKLVCDANGEPLKSDDAIKNIFQKLRQIRFLPIPKNINLSKPLAILKTHAGYVMTFMKGMEKFDIFLKLKDQIKEDEIPDWLKKDGKPIPDAEIWVNYCKSGGLRTRLIALYKISEQIAALHSNGLVYGDISCGNLMFKIDANGITAGLIDADNINFAGKSKTYFTPGFGAPEVVTGKSPATIFSDSYAFAVAAFYVITMMHPFKGSKVLGEESDDDDWANTVQTQQKADPGTFSDDGSFPWIFDKNDDSNSYGSVELVNSLFLTPTLFSLFDNTFSDGHTKPHLRTPLSLWSSAFAKAVDMTIKCPSCGMTYYYENEENGNFCCPYCQRPRPSILLAKSKLQVYSHELKKAIVLPRRVFEPFRHFFADDGVVKISLKNDFVEILSLLENENVYISENNGDGEILVGKRIFPLSDLQSGKTHLSFYLKKELSYSVSVEFYGAEQ